MFKYLYHYFNNYKPVLTAHLYILNLPNTEVVNFFMHFIEMPLYFDKKVKISYNMDI